MALNNLKKISVPCLLALMLLINAGCGTVGVTVRGGVGHKEPSSPPPPSRTSYPSYHSLHIPPGHLPPPGSCKVWYPGKPPGHQPPPTSCGAALSHAEPGTWILYRDRGNTEILEVKEARGRHPHVEIVVKHYLID